MTISRTKQDAAGEGANPEKAAAIVAWVRGKGSDTDNVRDAAHEASHALEFGVKKWDRRSIDVAALRKPRPIGMASEVLARAVEQLVCEALGVEHDWPNFMFIAGMESLKVGNPMPGPDWLTKAVAAAKKSDAAQAMAARILNLDNH